MKYWKIESIPDWLFICAPIMEEKTSFKINRQLVLEFKEIEEMVKNSSLKGWIGYAKLSDFNIMIMYLKVGAIPYIIEKEKIWFKKIT